MTVVSDLKAFLTQATFVTLAVAFVVGVQIGMVVSSLVSSIVDPAVGVVFKANFASVGLVTINGSTFTLGALFGAVLNFVIVLLVVFFVIVYPFALYTKRQAAKAAAARRPRTARSASRPSTSRRRGARSARRPYLSSRRPRPRRVSSSTNSGAGLVRPRPRSRAPAGGTSHTDRRDFGPRRSSST